MYLYWLCCYKILFVDVLSKTIWRYNIVYLSCSTLSSGQNGIAAIILKDALQPKFKQLYGRPMSDNVSVIMAKICSKYTV